MRLRGKEIRSLSSGWFRWPTYAPDPVYQEMVETYRNNPVLKEKAGELTATADKVGVANIFLQALKNASRAATWAFYPPTGDSPRQPFERRPDTERHI